MLVESALYQLIKNSSVMATVNGRVFGGVLPDTKEGKPFDSFPAIVYRPPENGGRRVPRILEGGCPLVEQPFLIFSASRNNYGEAALIDEALFHLLDEYRGVVTDPTKSPVESLEIEAVLATSLSHAYAYVDELRVHQFVTEYLFHYKDPLRGTSKF